MVDPADSIAAMIRASGRSSIDIPARVVALDTDRSAGFFVQPGTMLVLIGLDAAAVNSAAGAAAGGESIDDQVMVFPVDSVLASRRHDDITESLPVLGDLSYDGTTVVHDVFLFDSLQFIYAARLAWGGTDIDSGAFRFTYLAANNAAPEVVVIANPPLRQPDVDEIAGLVPKILADTNVAQFTPAAVIGAVATAVVGHYTDKVTDVVDRNAREHVRAMRNAEHYSYWGPGNDAVDDVARKYRARARGGLQLNEDVLTGEPAVDKTVDELVAERRALLEALRRPPAGDV